MGDKRVPRRPAWYFLSIAAMAVVYFLLSDKMLTSLKFREAIAPRLGPLARVLPVEFNWGLPILALLLLYWAVVWILDRGRPRLSERTGPGSAPARPVPDGQVPKNQGEDLREQGPVEKKGQEKICPSASRGADGKRNKTVSQDFPKTQKNQ